MAIHSIYTYEIPEEISLSTLYVFLYITLPSLNLVPDYASILSLELFNRKFVHIQILEYLYELESHWDKWDLKRMPLLHSTRFFLPCLHSNLQQKNSFQLIASYLVHRATLAQW